MKRTAPLGTTEGLRKTLCAFALMILLALPVVGLYPWYTVRFAARPQAHLHSEELKARAAAMCMAFGDPKPVVGQPEFVVERFQPGKTQRRRHLWFVECVAGQYHYNIIFNDLTGNMQCLFAEPISPNRLPAPSLRLALANRGEAVEGAIRRLKDVKMVPQGANIALAEKPELNRAAGNWHVIWKIRTPASSAPNEVRMLLSSQDATPLIVVNCNELEKYAQD